ncbi:hypothetical protein JQK92_07245 [Burkholderia anthina]|uniref:Uncharacterized protein n=1 Tax=Burkholderia anthina TaxID=179879 RepID=A0ABS2B029_9BURK|nr:hypothetical protein [Burkholderia anthina]
MRAAAQSNLHHEISTNRPPDGASGPNTRIGQAFPNAHHIDMPHRDEPEPTALLMRCCSISSIAARLARSRRQRGCRIERDDVEFDVIASLSGTAACCAAIPLWLSEIDVSRATQNAEHAADQAATETRRPSARVRSVRPIHALIVMTSLIASSRPVNLHVVAACRLEAHAWSGNIRELGNMIRHAHRWPPRA